MEQETKELVRSAFDGQPLLEVGEYKFIVNSLTEQIPATSEALLRAASSWLVEAGNFEQATKIAGEEDKGAILVAATALETGLPFGMARWYPSGLVGQVGVDFEMEYTSGQLFLNGIEKEDRVIIVDDMISTGGTMVALIAAIEVVGAAIVDIVCVAGKMDYCGVERVKEETGYKVKTLLNVSVSGARSKVI